MDVNESGFADNFVERSRYRDTVGPGPTFVEITDVEVAGDLVYLCTATRGLMSVARSDPSQLLILGTFPSSHDGRFPRCQHVRIDGEMVSITNRGDEIAAVAHLTLFNASDPTNLVQVATITDAEVSYEGHLQIAPDVYAVAAHSVGLIILERQGETFAEITRLGGMTNAWDMVRVGDTMLVADGAGGITMVDIADPRAPTLIGNLELPGVIKHLELGDGVVFAAAGADGVHILNIDDPASPTLVATFDTPGSALMTGFADGRLHVADWNDARVLDVSDPTVPTLLATENIDVVGFPRVLAIDAAGADSYLGEWTGLYHYELVEAPPAPDIRVASFELQFPKVEVGSESAVTLIIENEGEEQLEISNIEAFGADDVFSSLATELSIAPGDRDFIELRFRPDMTNPRIGTLELVSNDPDESELQLSLQGNRQGVGPGDPLPDYAWVDIESGETISTASLAGSVAVLSYFATF